MDSNCACVGCKLTREGLFDLSEAERQAIVEEVTRTPRPFIIDNGVAYINASLVKDARLEITNEV